MKQGGGKNKGLIGGLWDNLFSQFGMGGGGGDARRKKLIDSNEKMKAAEALKADIDKKLGTEKNPMHVSIDSESIAKLIEALGGGGGIVGPPKPRQEDVLGDVEIDPKIWNKEAGAINLDALLGDWAPAKDGMMQSLISMNNTMSKVATSPFDLLFSLFGFGAKGGMVRKYASGTGPAGAQFVPGTGNRDTVPAMLTPGEIVIPKGKRVGGNYNTTVNVNMEGGGDVTTDDEMGEAFGQAIQVAVTEEIAKQQIPGGLLSPFGGA